MVYNTIPQITIDGIIHRWLTDDQWMIINHPNKSCNRGFRRDVQYIHHKSNSRGKINQVTYHKQMFKLHVYLWWIPMLFGKILQILLQNHPEIFSHHIARCHEATLREWEPTALAKRLFCTGCGAQIAMDYRRWDGGRGVDGWRTQGNCNEIPHY